MKRIALIEDDPTVREELALLLENEGYQVLGVTDFTAVPRQVQAFGADLVLLDLGLPGKDGFALCAALRRESPVPIIIVTSRDAALDELKALSLGGDDYITKPFSVREVLARVRSVLRRTSAARAESESIRFEGLEIDLRRKVCTLDGKELQLTKKEFEILALLLSNRGVIFSREEILRRIWSDEVIVLDRTVDVNITRLRRKVGPYGEHIVTRLGYGYGFEA